MSDLASIEAKAVKDIEQADSLDGLEQVRVSYLGKKGEISLQMKQLGSMAPEERKAFGQQVNIVKDEVQAQLDMRRQLLQQHALNARLVDEAIDVSLPIRHAKQGSIHPVAQVIEECVAIFSKMGFLVQEGPEIEDDFHNFTALNIPPNHPARQMQDTFYLNAKDDQGMPYLLRTHTSSVQIRSMEENGAKPPFKLIAPGRVYRSDYDITHTPMFHQIEGLYVDKSVHMGHLKGCLYEFLKEFFELDEVPLRFRPSFFPFTEPSAEVDIGCARSKEQVSVGAGDDWLEILGCGMVHPNVLSNVGIDPTEYQGFAFGVGIERLAMLKYGAPDLRAFFDGDIRWLSHYGFGLLDIPGLSAKKGGAL